MASLDALDAHGTLNAIIAKRPEPHFVADSATGLLASRPVVIKDCFVDGGRAPTLGSRLRAEWMSGTATIIDRLENAGAAIVGYANMHEWMVGTTSRVSAFGPVVNPRDPSLIAGGSSGGSAAIVASGAVRLAVGTDAGGSIRIPAACCGVVGLKPTWGLVPTEGFVDHGSPVDHIGPIAATVGEAHQLLEVLADRSIPLPDARTLRVGVAGTFFLDQANVEIADLVRSATDRLAGHVRSVMDVEIDGASEARKAIGPFILRDVARMLRAHRVDWAGHVLPQTKRVVEFGARVTESDRSEAERTRARIARGWNEAFEKVDVIVTPTLPGPVAKIEDETVPLAQGDERVEHASVAWNAPQNLAGVPCLSVPCGATSDGRPVGISLTSATGRDGDALAVGLLLEWL